MLQSESNGNYLQVLKNAMKEVFNFSAGPAMLPKEVMEKAQSEFTNWRDLGCSVMEVSHRGKDFIEIAAKAAYRQSIPKAPTSRPRKRG